ncbi:MAG: FAD-dependent oxidoreductase [Gammaproteobacteria bacterium]|nr:MAG: FAD-dependent oxidoreductase [Gammaproteobacteria bacterium]
MEKNNVTVVGAGVVGIMSALHLQEEGVSVTVIDRQRPGNECSYGNAGVLGSATCIPISMPGVLYNVPGWILDPKGPLTINWKHAIRLFPWLHHFIRSGKKERVIEIADALDKLHKPTIGIYKHYASLASLENLIKENGYLHLFGSEESFNSTLFAREIRKGRGIKFSVLSRGEIKDLEPALERGFEKGILIERDGHTTNPAKLVSGLAELFKLRGGKIIRSDVTSIRFDNGKPKFLTTSSGKYLFENLVICAGAWSRGLLRQLGEKVLLEAERGYHIEIKDPGVEISRPVFFVDKKFLATSMEGGLRLAGTAEYNNLHAPPDFNRARILLPQAKKVFRDFDADNYSEWMGSRPSTPDSMPVICKSRKYDSIFYAFGHGHTGMAGAPMTGKLISELVAGKTPSIDISPFSLYRF